MAAFHSFMKLHTVGCCGSRKQRCVTVDKIYIYIYIYMYQCTCAELGVDSDGEVPHTLQAAQTGSARLQTLWDASIVQSDVGHADWCTDL